MSGQVAGCVLRRGPGCRLVQSWVVVVGGGGQAHGRKGVMQLWALPAHRPSGKELFMASTHDQPFEKKSWEGSRKEAASLYAASLRQLEPFFSLKKMCWFFKNLGRHDIWFLVTSLFWLHLHPISTSMCADFVFASLILLPDYFGSNTQNGGRELESWKAERGSHFLTDPGSGTKVKNF